MAEQTGIEWCHHTFNPWMGCTKVSAGCKHCYAERENLRYGKHRWGPGAERQVTSDTYWKQPLKWDRKAAADGVRRRVFCGSWCDVFEDRPDLVAPRARLFELIEQTPHLDWLLLTKRPENVVGMVPAEWQGKFPANVWVGTSVEDQETANKRIPALLQIPARIRFLSCEPLLDKVLLDNGETSWLTCDGENRSGIAGEHVCCEAFAVTGHHFHGIDWVIAGGESGPDARPMHPDHAYSLLDQCQAAGIPFFFKQWGEWTPRRELPEGTQVTASVVIADEADVFAPGYELLRAGKRAAGRLLRQRTWDEVPA
ncbi:MAG: phage Gp37/Gp68 family protein [Anaerolineales bacterium]|nr:phage Gp37/Gp68 family protein [Anaerolineales bacterium]